MDRLTRRQAGRITATLILSAALFFAMPVAGGTDSQDAEMTCLARTLYFEAGIEGRSGMVAVAWVILNRMRDGEYPRTVCGVVKQGSEKPGCQFSYWCDGKSDTPKPDENWALALDVAKRCCRARRRDPTGGAVFYHAADTRAPWSATHVRTAQIGRHIYYR